MFLRSDVADELRSGGNPHALQVKQYLYIFNFAHEACYIDCSLVKLLVDVVKLSVCLVSIL